MLGGCRAQIYQNGTTSSASGAISPCLKMGPTLTNDWIDTSHVLGSFWSSLGVGEEEEVPFSSKILKEEGVSGSTFLEREWMLAVPQIANKEPCTDLADQDGDRDLFTVVTEKASATMTRGRGSHKAISILRGLHSRCLGGGEEGGSDGDVRLGRWGLGGETRRYAALGLRGAYLGGADEGRVATGVDIRDGLFSHRKKMNPSAGASSKQRAGASQPSETSYKRKRGVFQKELQHMMYGFGDDPNVSSFIRLNMFIGPSL
ncbi:hypothetical protein TIFTF001_003883 [Ficus carica]|uniref:Uncharacterized protein n=1 Tax=Ficus carica TaxID=3494 RepID=A0AA87ZHP6_FICCA|nr:hypothetical protein TIFTF001_003883 [Ficus carica]